jgi:cytochrome P450
MRPAPNGQIPASALPVRVISEVLGVPEAGRRKLREWERLLTGSLDPELAHDAAGLNALAVNAGAPIRSW